MLTLELQGVDKRYHKDGKDVVVLDDVSFSAKSGELVAIVGESGAGKTTLIKLITGIDAIDGGEIIVNGRSSRAVTLAEFRSYMSTLVGYISQDYQLLPYMNVYDNVLIGQLLMPGVDEGESRAKAERILELVGLGDRASYFPSELSGGQQQRVAVARALVRDAEIILADEPTGNLDWPKAQQVIDLLREVAHTMDRLVLMVTHDQRIASRADRVVRIDQGRLRADE